MGRNVAEGSRGGRRKDAAQAWIDNQDLDASRTKTVTPRLGSPVSSGRELIVWLIVWLGTDTVSPRLYGVVRIRKCTVETKGQKTKFWATATASNGECHMFPGEGQFALK